MPARTHRKKTAAHDEQRHLRSIPGGRSEGETSPVGELFTGRVRREPVPSTRRRKREPPPQELPGTMQTLANILAAGRVVEKEIRFKADYAKQAITRYCIRDFIRRYISGGRRPASAEYVANHARFKFVLTSRTTLTTEKVEALRDLGIPIEEYTELKELQIDSDAIRQHGIEKRLIQALESMNLSKAVLNEVLRPKVELKETFYDLILEVVRRSLQKGENLEEKMIEVFEALSPAEQIRNVEAPGLDAEQCFDLIQKAKIETEE